MDNQVINTIKDTVITQITSLGPKFLYALITLVLGLLIVKLLFRLVKRILRRSSVEKSLRTFIESLTIFLLYGLLGVSISAVLGATTSSIVTIFGAASIAIGLALQGSLANFAGGVLILVFKPFRVGDLIYVNNNLGEVTKIDILYTRIITFDGRIITMPNGNVANTDIDNRTMNPKRRIGLNLKFSFNEDLDKVRNIMLDTMWKHPLILKDPEPDVRLNEIGEYEMKLIVRCWAESSNYWQVYWEQLEAIKKALDAEGIEMPVPKRELINQ
ncbi:MAG: mechanosensitive ion channel [Psychroflexus sp.]|nr:mechanosensitive ion channel [Psychroflexus sp.]